ncbi:type II toxin-antitoxin system Phd/YefM family antitoxin [Actinoplanes sp. NPDC051494]|uniref:type II toxin-antitoxin system Phd/YefM family antitoxin n=1 Tax=Actinoplanes sp. NPDC051494 TaxID=3363907 RepID=UPI0037AB3738
MPTIIPLNEVKTRLSEMVGRVADHHEEIVVTVHGRPVAVLMGLYEYESMKETLDVLGDHELMRQLDDYDADPATVSADEVRAMLEARPQEHGRAVDRAAFAAHFRKTRSRNGWAASRRTGLKGRVGVRKTAKKTRNDPAA